ncbi:MAG: hypothetical protein KAT77_04630 [Nanoarchaeota archaeon]|nr:hypothetical protein [Nanoarchaeota archaeon]
MNLREKLRILEKEGELHDFAYNTLFGTDTYKDISDKVDEKFRICLREWRERKSLSGKMGANILIYMMAIRDTREYKKQRIDLDKLAEEIDCEYTPGELLQYLEPDLIPNRLRNDRMKTRVRRGILDVEYRKDERLTPFAHYLKNFIALISKE